LALGELNDEVRANLVWQVLQRWNDSRWRSLAVLSSAYDQPWLFFNSSKLTAAFNRQSLPSLDQALLLGKLAEQIGRTQSDRDVPEFLTWLTETFHSWPANSATNAIWYGAKLFFLSEFARSVTTAVYDASVI
jgi:hypothetical protein